MRLLRYCQPLLPLLCLFALTACGRYQFFVNEQLIYSPPLLLKDIRVEDDHLAQCLRQTIEDQEITQVNQLQRLNCSNAGIQSLAGLEQFANLKHLNFDANKIKDLSALLKLSQLKTLYLADNQIDDLRGLSELKELTKLRLTGNPGIDCSHLKRLIQARQGTLEALSHCDS